MHQKIEAGTVRRWQADQYYEGRQAISFLKPEDAKALGDRLRTLNVNYCRLQVESIVERLRIDSFAGDGQPIPAMVDAWARCGFEEQHQTLFREALVHGTAFVIVWADAQGRATLSVESSAEVAVISDPLTGEPTAAVKRWQDGDLGRCVLFTADSIREYHVKCPAGGVLPSQGWELEDSRPNPLQVVPVVPFVNRSRLLDQDGSPEFDSIVDLQDALVKLLTDLMVSSEYGSRPRRWATGLTVKVDAEGNAVNPFSEGPNRVWQNEHPEGKFGQFPSADLGGYQSSVEQILKLISAASGLPAHYMAISNTPLSADSIRAAESSLVARVEAKQTAFARSWLRVVSLVLAVEGLPAPADVDIQWRDPASRTLAQAADAAVKLHAERVITTDAARRLTGFSQAEIDAMNREQARADVDALLFAQMRQPSTTPQGVSAASGASVSAGDETS
ncbi:phage portal protein [Mariniluteicoccus endophyticus]